MEVPPEITFRGLEKTDEIEEHILARTAKLDAIHPHISSAGTLLSGIFASWP